MKRITVLTISLLLLLFASFTTSPVVGGNSIIHTSNVNYDVGIDQGEEITDSYYPIFNGINIESGVTTQDTIRNRNNTLGEGAIVQIDSNAVNITFRYQVALQNTSTFDNTVNMELFADLPRVNTTNFNNTLTPELSLTDSSKTLQMEYQNTNSTGNMNYTHPLTGDIIPNATLYDFETTLKINMTVDYLPFYAAETTASPDVSEAQNDGAYNLLTTDAYFNTTSVDEFYVQNEIVNITGSIFFQDFTNIDGFGIDYRVNTGSTTSVNFTLAVNANNATGEINLDSYEPGTVISWDSVLYVANDTSINQSRIISGIDSKRVDVGDGTPELTIEINTNDPKGLVKADKVYSQNNEITFNVTAIVPKGNITDVSLEVVNETFGFTFSQVNNSFTDIELSENVTYGSEGEYLTILTATTDKGLTVSQNYTVYFDLTPGEIFGLSVSNSDSGTLVTSDGEVTFSFDFADDNSGVMLAVLDLGNGESLGVEGLNEITYRYSDFDGQTYFYKLTVIDFAGNEVTASGSITLEASGLGETSGPLLGFGIFIVVMLLVLTSFKWGPVLTEKLGR